ELADGALYLRAQGGRVIADITGFPGPYLVGKFAQPLDARLYRPIVAVQQLPHLVDADGQARENFVNGIPRRRVLRQDASWMVARAHRRLLGASVQQQRRCRAGSSAAPRSDERLAQEVDRPLPGEVGGLLAVAGGGRVVVE